MAAAVVSGVAALVIEANRAALPTTRPALTPNTMKAILQYTAFTLHDEQDVAYDMLTQGAGGLNADGALALASAIDTSLTGGNWFIVLLHAVLRHQRHAALGAERRLGRERGLG